MPQRFRCPRHLPILALTLVALFATTAAHAFCGFYVAKAESDLFNQASKVVIVRDGDRTVLTMANDYEGDPSEFAIVVPVPTFLEREQIHVADRAVIEHLDAYTAPRLVEYFDPDPCHRVMNDKLRSFDSVSEDEVRRVPMPASAASLGVTIEAEYSVGEYEILILSAEESQGLETWLRQEGYRIPDGASEVLGSYLKQDMRFFVAKVDLEKQSELGFTYLRPLQVAFETPKFMLPIRLGTVNANGPQELIAFVLNRSGRVETTNYRTVELPTGQTIPEFVENDFGEFYRAMFAHEVEKEKMRTVFLEYAWDMGWCDPCAADPLSAQELRQLGVFWIEPQPVPKPRPGFAPPRPQPQPRPQDVFVTRLHLRYTAETFPEDLRFQETGDRQNFQGRYVLQRPWKGDADQCAEAERYFAQLPERRHERAETLARLTGWELAEILGRMDVDPGALPVEDDEPWWKKLWGG